jgi:hypothetical protein
MFSGGGQSHQNRPFSPYRHAPTTEDLLHAAIRGRAMALPDPVTEPPAPSQHSRAPSVLSSAVPSKAPSAVPSVPRSHHTVQSGQSQSGQAIHITSSHKTASAADQGAATPTSRRPHSPPLDLNQEEAQIVQDALASRTPRTSHYTPSALGSDIVNSHYHDMDLCVLLQQESDPNVHEVVKKALRKAIRQRVKRLGMKYDNEVCQLCQFTIFYSQFGTVHQTVPKDARPRSQRPSRSR